MAAPKPDFGSINDVIMPHWPDADEGALANEAGAKQGLLSQIQGVLDQIDQQVYGGKKEAVSGSDSEQGVDAERQKFNALKEAWLEQMKSQANFEKMTAENVKNGRSQITKTANDALAEIAQAQAASDSYRSSVAGRLKNALGLVDSQAELEAKIAKIKDQAGKTAGNQQSAMKSSNEDVYTGGSFGRAAGMNADTDTSYTFGRQAGYTRGDAAQGESLARQAGYTRGDAAQGESLARQAGYTRGDAAQGESLARAADSQQSTGSSASGGSSGSGGSGGGASGSGGAGGGASTGLQSGAAVAERGADAAPQGARQAGGGGGGIGAPPSISGIGGGPAGGGPGGGSRIGGIGAGGSEVSRTGVQGGGAAEKPAAQPSSGAGEQRGAGLSRAGGSAGAGGVGGETRAMSAQQAALKDAMRGDTAGGASGTGRHLEQQGQALGTQRVTELSPTALMAARGETARVAGSFSGLRDRIAAAHPAAGAGELADLITGGGVVVGAGRAGFLADGFTWGRVEQPPFEHVGSGGLVFLFEDMRVAPNPQAGVWRPVVARVTTTGWLGQVDPAMRLPEGTRVLDRSKAPAGTDHLTNPGLLAVGLAKWLLEDGLGGDSSWRLAAVCFLEEPDSRYVQALLALPRPVEAYWPDRPGYEADVPQAAVQDARALSSEELAVKQSDPLRHAADMARLAPDGLYDPAGLPPKEAGWYRKSVQRANSERITNARWKQELDQYRREERGAGALNW